MSLNIIIPAAFFRFKKIVPLRWNHYAPTNNVYILHVLWYKAVLRLSGCVQNQYMIDPSSIYRSIQNHSLI